MSVISDQFLLICKRNYLNKIYPSAFVGGNDQDYRALIDIVKYYFKNNLHHEFSEFFKEGTYLVDLWAAHLFLEYGNNDKQLIHQAMQIIKDYSTGTSFPDLSNNERNWLMNNEIRYKEQ